MPDPSSQGISQTQLRRLPAWARQRNLSATYPRAFMEVAAERGISSQRILISAGLPTDLLDDPAGQLSLLETWLIFEALLRQADDPALGFEAGRRLPLTAHGSLGYALMCASTPREAISVLERFWHLRGRGVVMRAEETDTGLFFELTPTAPIPATLRDFLFGSMLTSMYGGIRFMLPDLSGRVEIWLQGPRPENFRDQHGELPTIRFAMPRAGIALEADKARIDQPLPTANPEAFSQAIAQCERESVLNHPADDLSGRVRASLIPGRDGYPAPEQLAASLNVSPRTLRRRLQEQGQSYQTLLEEARRRDSQQLLENRKLEIRQVAAMLGYTDPANFTRAFRSWTGMAPSVWRQARQVVEGNG